jgi:hypothetical protein
MAVTGGCLCKAVKFECGDLGSAGYCHCEDCRRCTGSPFNVSVRCATSAFHILSGELGSFSKTGESGFSLTRHFCLACGSPIFTSSPRDPSVIFIKAGALDNPDMVKPTLEAWVRSKVTWANIPAGIASFEKGRSEAK